MNLQILWPVTIVKSRYGGTYEGAEWLAFNNSPEQVGAGGALGDDCECLDFFADPGLLVGKGSTPDEALSDLEKQFVSKQ